MLRTHPVTRRTALFLGRRVNSYVLDLPVNESEALLDKVWAHATQEQFTYRHHWQKGDIVLWDNRCVMHRREPFDNAEHIEEVIVVHPAVVEVAVFGVPNDKWGEVPVAAVTLLGGKDPAPVDLIEWINERVSAKFQRVADCVVLSKFPRNVAGKTLKREIREDYLAAPNLT